MNHIKNKNISDLNFEEQRWWILERFVQIEKKIDSIILEYINPSKDRRNFVSDILLNSSILHFWAKMKILSNIYPESWSLLNDIRTLSNIRNAFAHCFGYGHIIAKINPWWIGSVVSYKKKFKVMNANWVLKDKYIEDELKNFHDIYSKIEKSLG